MDSKENPQYKNLLQIRKSNEDNVATETIKTEKKEEKGKTKNLLSLRKIKEELPYQTIKTDKKDEKTTDTEKLTKEIKNGEKSILNETSMSELPIITEKGVQNQLPNYEKEKKKLLLNKILRRHKRAKARTNKPKSRNDSDMDLDRQVNVQEKVSGNEWMSKLTSEMSNNEGSCTHTPISGRKNGLGVKKSLADFLTNPSTRNHKNKINPSEIGKEYEYQFDSDDLNISPNESFCDEYIDLNQQIENIVFSQKNGAKINQEDTNDLQYKQLLDKNSYKKVISRKLTSLSQHILTQSRLFNVIFVLTTLAVILAENLKKGFLDARCDLMFNCIYMLSFCICFLEIYCKSFIGGRDYLMGFMFFLDFLACFT